MFTRILVTGWLISLLATPLAADELTWRLIHQGDYGLAQKCLLTQQPSNIEETVQLSLMWAYFFYRQNDQELMRQMFKNVDDILEATPPTTPEESMP